MSRTRARRHLAAMARAEFGERWVPAIRAFWRAWRELGLPEMDQAPADRVLSAIGIVLAALKQAGEQLDGTAVPLRHARVALGLPPVPRTVD